MRLITFCLIKIQGKTGYASLKLDISKAYDWVEWTFLESALLRIGFHPLFVSRIMMCITSVSFSFLLNGEKFGFLRPERASVRVTRYHQALSHLIRQPESQGVLKGISIARGAPSVSHLLFVNDTMIFFRVSPEAMQVIKRILYTFEKVSGLKINLSKSALVVSKNVSDLTQGIVKELERMMASFLWQGGEGAKVHWVAWSKLCRSKKEGGLGFHRLKEFNLAMLAKQAWRMAINPNNLLHLILQQKCFPNSSLLEAGTHQSSSFTRRSLLCTRDLLVVGVRWRVGNG
ncbi:UNVERIFIED_CONTAM: hypothetical protein Sradi_4397300 [Sesamum radiatum]|uniref:Reverse transcriptase domain-containing protein n=1 Tax=Sesamum radiatum TaxID=300843 RepID=A0AAW2NP42_SESRA